MADPDPPVRASSHPVAFGAARILVLLVSVVAGSAALVMLVSVGRSIVSGAGETGLLLLLPVPIGLAAASGIGVWFGLRGSRA